MIHPKTPFLHLAWYILFNTSIRMRMQGCNTRQLYRSGRDQTFTVRHILLFVS